MPLAIIADVWNLAIFESASSRNALGEAYAIYSGAINTFLYAFAA
jgi:hypothetical protein